MVRRPNNAGPVRGAIREMAVVDATTGVEANIPLSPALTHRHVLDRPRLLAGRVVAAVLLQGVGYAAILVLCSRDDPRGS